MQTISLSDRLAPWLSHSGATLHSNANVTLLEYQCLDSTTLTAMRLPTPPLTLLRHLFQPWPLREKNLSLPNIDPLTIHDPNQRLFSLLHHRANIYDNIMDAKRLAKPPHEITLYHIESLYLGDHSTYILEGEQAIFCIDTLTFKPRAQLIVRTPFPLLIGTLTRRLKNDLPSPSLRRYADITFAGQDGQLPPHMPKMGGNPYRHGQPSYPYSTLLIQRLKGIFYVACRGGHGINGRDGVNNGNGEDGGNGGSGGDLHVYYGKTRKQDGSILTERHLNVSRVGSGGMALFSNNRQGMACHAGRMGIPGTPGVVTIRLCKTAP